MINILLNPNKSVGPLAPSNDRSTVRTSALEARKAVYPSRNVYVKMSQSAPCVLLFELLL